MNSTSLAVLLALFSAAAGAQEAEAPRLRGSLGFGVGTQYAFTGLRGELGYGAFTGFISIPVSILNKAFFSTDGLIGTLGARWSPRGGSGPFIDLHAMLTVNDGPMPDYHQETDVVFAANAGWRWRLGPAWLEVAAGPAVSHSDHRFPQRDYEASNGKLDRRWFLGVVTDGALGESFPFDFSLGLGFQF